MRVIHRQCLVRETSHQRILAFHAVVLLLVIIIVIMRLVMLTTPLGDRQGDKPVVNSFIVLVFLMLIFSNLVYIDHDDGFHRTPAPHGST